METDPFAPFPIKTFRRCRAESRSQMQQIAPLPHSTALSRTARLLSRARPLTSTSVAGAQHKKKRKKEEREREEGSSSQQGFASISDVVIDLGAVKA